MAKRHHNEAVLDALIDQLHKSAESAIAAIDDAIAYVALSNERIVAMEAEHEANRKARHKIANA